MKINFNNIKSKFKPNPKVFKILVLLLIIVGTTYGGYTYYQTYSELKRFEQNPELVALKERAELIERVKSIVSVPDEEPTVATVQDSNKLKGQAFFSRALNGDKVLIFPKSGRAILYRPSTDKVIEAAPVNITDLQQTVQGNPTQVADVGQTSHSDDVLRTKEESIKPINTTKIYKLAVYNGTRTVDGLAGKGAQLIEDKFGEDTVEIIELDNASEYYENTLVVNFTGAASTFLEELLKAVGGSLVELPKEEDEPNVDFLIILGTDFVEKI